MSDPHAPISIDGSRVRIAAADGGPVAPEHVPAIIAALAAWWREQTRFLTAAVSTPRTHGRGTPRRGPIRAAKGGRERGTR